MTPLMKRFSRSIPALALGGVLLAMTAAPAHAENSSTIYNSTRAAKGWFTDSGNKLTACDIRTDGEKAVLWIWNRDVFHPIEWYVTDRFNNGHCTTRTSPIVLQPRTYYDIQVCLGGSAGLALKCGSWHLIHNVS